MLLCLTSTTRRVETAMAEPGARVARVARVARLALLAAVTVSVVGVVPAAAAGQAKPRAGRYAGQEVYDNNPLPVTFNVSRDRSRVVRFTGQAVTKDGCTNHITSFQAPSGPMTITAAGRFSATSTSTSYPQPGVRVKVTGTFVSRLKAKGHISIRISKHRDCNARRPFTAQRTQ
jgi:hypothetical protein